MWLKGRDPSGNFQAPEVLLQDPKKIPKDAGPSNKWQEIVEHMQVAVRGKPEDLQTPTMYEPGNVRTGFKVARPIPPFYSRVVSGDTRDNP